MNKTVPVLSREALRSGAYLQSFADTPELPRWSLAQIQQSLQQALAQRPDGQAVWLFAYGSLIWNPLFHYASMQPAVLEGWQRSFCVRLESGRGCHQYPGRMLALQTGGVAAGVAFQLNEQSLQEELLLVWVREMVHGLYQPLWQTIQLNDGSQQQALAFVMDNSHSLYEADASIATVAPIIQRAKGHLGSNLDYLLTLAQTLQHHGIHDPYIQQLAAAVI